MSVVEEHGRMTPRQINTRLNSSCPSVYLAGPITGLTYDGSTEWRDSVAAKLAEVGINVFSPLRCKQYLRDLGPLEKQYQGIHPLSNDRGIVTRDHNDVVERDMMLVNFLGCGDRVSVGTVWELGICFTHRKPVVVVMEEGNIHEHAMVNETAGYVVRTLEEGLEIVQAVLLP